jgi:hypothetical protein
MGPPRECISSTLINHKLIVEREWEWSESSTVKEEEFGSRLIVSIVFDFDKYIDSSNQKRVIFLLSVTEP